MTDLSPSSALVPAVSRATQAAVLLVELESRAVVHANDLAVQLAPGVGLPASVDAWSDAAGLRDLEGAELSETAHPLSLAAEGRPVAGQPVTAQRPSDATDQREPLFAIGLPLGGAAGLEGHALVVMLPLREREAVSDAVETAKASAQLDAGLRDRAVLATGISFTLADAGTDDTPLTWVNPAFTATTGYSLAESVGHNCRFLQGPDTDRDTVASLREAVQAGRDVTATLLNYRKDGTRFWNQLSMSPVRDGAGRVTHFVGVQTDVTERVEADRARQAAFEAADQARAETARALQDAQVAARRLALVAEATSLLTATLDVPESLDRLARLVVPLLADGVLLALVDERGALDARPVARYRDDGDDLVARLSDLLAEGSRSAGALNGVLTDANPAVLDPALAQAASLLAVPLVARRRVLGVMLMVSDNAERPFGTADLELAADLGRRAGLAVDNAQLYTRQHQAAVALQRGLLPSLPDVPGLALAAEYLPAGQEAQVGGDWWDVFALPDGATAVTIGDVMGHDLVAAAAMGQLRSVLRTCAWVGDGPAVVLERMDQLVQGFDMAQLATCVYARVQPADDARRRRRLPRLSWSNAGHLPPVLLQPDGEARLLTGALSVPLGVPSTEPRGVDSVSLQAGSTVLLYTDGLVESRTGSIDDDVADLRARIARHRPADGPQALVDRLIGDLDVLADDVAVLAVQML